MPPLMPGGNNLLCAAAATSGSWRWPAHYFVVLLQVLETFSTSVTLKVDCEDLELVLDEEEPDVELELDAVASVPVTFTSSPTWLLSLEVSPAS